MGFYPPDENLKYLAELDAVLADNAPVASTPDGLGEPLPVTDSRGPKVADVVGTEEPAYDQTPPEPEAPVAAAPAQTPPVAPAAQPAPIRQPAPVVAQTQGEQSKLVQTKPNWYDDLAPPDNTGGKIAAGLFGSLLGMAATPSGRGRRGRREANEQRIAGLLGGVGNAVAAGVNAPMENYQNRLKAAGAQADMHAKLNSGGAASPEEQERLRLAQEKWRAKQEEDARKLAEEKALGGMDTPETIKERQIASNLSKGPDGQTIPGGLTDQQLAAMNGADIRRWRTGLQQQAGQARGLGNTKGLINIRTGLEVDREGRSAAEHDRRFEQEQGAKIEAGERDRVASIEAASIPGLELINPKRPPSTTSVERAREMQGAKESLIDAATRLAELQGQVKSVVSQGLGSWNAVFGDVEQADILAEMKFLQQQLAADQRTVWHQGVPQQFEIVNNRKTNPEADSPFTFFNGEIAWGAMARTAARRADMQLKAYNYRTAGGDTPEVGEAPARGSSAVKNPAEEIRKGSPLGQKAVGTAIEAGKAALGNAADTVGQVAGAVAPAAKKIMARVNKGGKWSDPMPVSKKRFDELKAQLGDALEEVAQ